jgi:acyl-CoA reductase-like NAD-dependent aldehyde dehydrogenase
MVSNKTVKAKPQGAKGDFDNNWLFWLLNLCTSGDLDFELLGINYVRRCSVYFIGKDSGQNRGAVMEMISSQSAQIDSINPSTLKVLGRVAIADKLLVETTVTNAWKAYGDWQLTSFSERFTLMTGFKKRIETHKDELAKLIANEAGIPYLEVLTGEVAAALDCCQWLIDNAENHLKDQTIQLGGASYGSKQTTVTFESIGVVGVITPWQYPFSTAVQLALFSLAAGNTVVIKPSEKTSLIGIKVEELFQEAGFPPGCVSVVTGDPDTGKFLSECKLAKLVFVGSTSSGSAVVRQASKELTPLSLSLGGKDAAIVLPDAPVDWTARGLVWGAFANSGQSCGSIERVYIVRGKKSEQLIERIIQLTQELRIGPADQSQNEIGPIIDEEHFEAILSQIKDAEGRGARIACGGKPVENLEGFYLEPAVILDADQSMRIMQEETCGPVMPIVLVGSEDEAVEKANESAYGLSASVWGGNLARAQGVARDLMSGTVYVNDCLFARAVPQLPWGGYKKSGYGRSHSSFGLIDLVNIKSISVDSAGGAGRFWWYPYGEARSKVARAFIQLHHGNLIGRLKALFDIFA